MRFTRRRVALVLGSRRSRGGRCRTRWRSAAKVAGTLSFLDQPQLDRLFRDGVASNCFGLPRRTPGWSETRLVRVRDTYTYFNAIRKDSVHCTST